MDSVETLIPDNEGNHLVIVLNFYEDSQKTDTFQIPTEFTGLDIADISIEKLNLNQPLGLRAFNKYRWNLFELFYQRNVCKLTKLGIESKDIIVGPKGYQSFARVFYRASHTPIFLFSNQSS